MVAAVSSRGGSAAASCGGGTSQALGVRCEDELLENDEVKALGNRDHNSEVERLVDLCEACMTSELCTQTRAPGKREGELK
jgi:hypothetical protein